MENVNVQSCQTTSEANRGHIDTFAELFVTLGQKVVSERSQVDFYRYGKNRAENELVEQRKSYEAKLKVSTEYGRKCDAFISEQGIQIEDDTARIKQLNLDVCHLKLAIKQLEATNDRLRGKNKRRS